MLLPKTAFNTLMPKRIRSTYDFALVVSHDCDLAQSIQAEPNVELILGNWLPACNGSFTHSKNARRLHLPFSDGVQISHAELRATDKRTISKKKLSGFEPDKITTLSPDDHLILQRWLSARYRRSAFPEEFDSRIDKGDIPKRLAKLVGPTGPHIKAIFFDISDANESENSSDGNYELYIFVLYSEETTGNSYEVALKISNSITSLFQNRFYDKTKKTWNGIELTGCEPISDQVMPIAQVEKLRRWNGDHISLRAEPQQAPLD